MSTIAQTVELQPPTLKAVPKVLEKHGDHRTDNYFWLRDRSNPDVLSYLNAENKYTEAQMADTKALQDQLYKEIVGRIQEDDTSAPVQRGEYFYFTRTQKGKQYPVYLRRKGAGGPEEVLLDGNVLGAGQKYFQVGAFVVSPDQKLLAYATDTAGDETFTVQVKDLTTGKLLPDQIRNAYYSVEWGADNKTLFYNVLNESKRPFKVFRHTLGSAAADAEVFHEPDERFEVTINKTRSRQYLLIDCDSQTTSEVWYLRADQPAGQFTRLYERIQDVEYQVTDHGQNWYVRTSEGAKTFRLMEAPIAQPQTRKEIIAARPDVTLEDVDTYADHLVVTERAQGLLRLLVRRFSDGQEHLVSMPEPDYTLAGGGGFEYNTTVLRFSYTSLVTPPSVFDYDMNSRQRTLVKQQAVLGGFKQENYVSERIMGKASDGTLIPISVVSRKGLVKDGSNPCLLYGYGAYGISSDPTFSVERISLLDRGFVYAIAHIRGGGDLGKPWHEAGRMLNKQRTFTDFIAAAQMLIARRYTQPKKLGILGGSAGGLLMGAVVNLRPDLFGAVVAKVPFVDMLSTMMDASLPLTVGEYEEWGNPEDPKYYSYMRTYSPYDNVERQVYPNMLVTAGLNDPRVSYWEPAKWVAKLRTMKKGSNLLLLKTNMGAGHFGASGRYERFKDTAFDYAFLLKALGATGQSASK
ncbi:S9 family peptidase [uncultured Paludibaculum sp.]|uniref:S9 family peptidase n=1 Tax=uncultured Paludibaculum sp. TaxID=1765020 RepID=UPI002AABC705|nr:S9 family peptidase [uncultured Paludibaculum sp.]